MCGLPSRLRVLYDLHPGLFDVTDSTARSAADTGAGVLELLRLFKDDQAFADQYAAVQLEKAKAVEPAVKAFEYLPQNTTRRPGPLSGIPVAVKDIIATADMPTTNGSPIYRDHIPAADAWVVERLRSLGATIFGKTVSTEFAWRHPGPTVNPGIANIRPGDRRRGPLQPSQPELSRWRWARRRWVR
jgi:Asp-tRNA(Asn)/Glu-tRNA(Gln) amidotransferase A subunit family amidase